MSEIKFHDEETLPNGIKVKRLLDFEQKEESWLASIAIREPGLFDYDPRYYFCQSNGKTRQEAIDNLMRMVEDSIPQSEKEIVEMQAEIVRQKSLQERLKNWLAGGEVEVL